ncbi:hypothetical protein ACFT6Z_24425 [Streptomyces sp. NPDC057131]
MRIDRETAPEHRDGPFHFCSAHCAAACDADPVRYGARAPG